MPGSCTYPGCVNVNESSSFNLCNLHKCNEISCNLVKLKDSNFCKLHSMSTCEFKECTRKILNMKYCYKHRCIQSGCNEGKKLNKPYCNIHIIDKPICQKSSCSKVTEQRYCEDHKCLSPPCESKRGKDEKYCKFHVKRYCRICKTRCVGFDYCDVHKCRKSHCKKQKDTWRKYCFDHECLQPGCNKSRRSNKKYCSLHLSDQSVCQNKKCDRTTLNSEMYCENHKKSKCLAAGCEKKTKEKFCSKHLISGEYLESKGIHSKEGLKLWFKKNHPDKSGTSDFDAEVFTKIRMYGQEIYPSG